MLIFVAVALTIISGLLASPDFKIWFTYSRYNPFICGWWLAWLCWFLPHKQGKICCQRCGLVVYTEETK